MEVRIRKQCVNLSPPFEHAHIQREYHAPTMTCARNWQGKSRSKTDLAQFAVKGYKVTPAISALKSPFGPIEDFKAYLVHGIHLVQKFVMERLESGTPT